MLVVLAIAVALFGVGGVLLANTTTTIRVSLLGDDPIPESSGVARFRIRLSDPLENGQAVVTVRTVQRTGANAATAGADYTAVSQVLTFSAGGPSSYDVDVPILADTTDELNEVFDVELAALDASGTTTNVLLGAPVTAVIEDDDSPNLVSITGPAGPVAEDAGNASFTVTIDAPSVQSVTVGWQLVGSGANPATIPPAPNNDVTVASGSWVIPAGSTSRSFTIGIVDDAITEPSEQFTVDIVSVANVANAAAALALDPVVTIADNDTPPSITTNTGLTVAEGATGQITAARLAASDPQQGPASLTFTVGTAPVNGTLFNGAAPLAAGGTFTQDDIDNNLISYTHSGSETTSDSFTFTVSDGALTAGPATFNITITPVDDPPTAVNDSATVAEDALATAIPVLANDTDPDGGAKLITAVSDPANGTVVITGGGAGLTYRPDANYCNSPGGSADTFTYTITGGSQATVSVTVTCVDDLPTAVNDSATVAEDSGANAIDVLANDTDIDGGPKTVASVTQPASGTVVITGGGTGLTYQPNANYCNSPGGSPATFTYRLNGGSQATVSVTVTCADDNPTAVNDTRTVAEDAPATAIDVLANDTDPDGGPKTIASTTDPANGTVVITGGGTGLTYQPDANYCNSPGGSADTFSYTLAPGGSSATVSVTVTCVDDLPTAVNDSATVAEDSGATAIDVLANDTDIDGGPKTVASVTQPASGTVVITGGGSGLTYQPDANYCNSPGGTADTFTYLLNGGSQATVSVTVTCVDDAPVANDDSATVAEDAAAAAINVLANDSDPEGDTFTVTAVTQPANGTVTLVAGVVSYAPDADYCNSPGGSADTFTYTITGGDTATVSVTVTCVDDPATAVDDSTTVAEDSGATAVDVLANETDIDDVLDTVASVTQPANGTVVITGGGTGLTYEPDADYCNSPGGSADTFTYTLSGGSSATVSVTVTCVNDAPVVDANGATAGIDATASYTEGGAPAILVAADLGISDVDSTTITGAVAQITDTPANPADLLAVDPAALPAGVTAAYDAASGTLTLSGPATLAEYAAALATLSFDHSSNNPGASRTITVAATDDGAPAATSDPAAVITLSIVEDDEAPTLATNTGLTVAEGGSGNITPAELAIADNDTPASELVYTLSAVPANGILELGVDTLTVGDTFTQADIDSGELSYTHDDSETTSDSFSFTATDGTTPLPAATFAITITAANDAPAVTLTSGATDYTQGDPAVLVDAGATVADADSADFAGGALTVTLSGSAAGDTLAIRNEGTGAGQIGVSGATISFGGQPIGSFTGGSGAPLEISFSGASATPAAAQALLRNITFASTSAVGGPRTATVVVSDGDGLTSASASKVIAYNRLPLATDDSATVVGDSGATALPVLANDSDPDNDGLTIAAVTQGANGAVVITGAGAGLTYQPDPGFVGEDSFTYTVSDGRGGSDTATVTVTVSEAPAQTFSIFLPMLAAAPAALPDLEVSISVTPATPQAGAPASIQVTVTNTGDGPASNFWVDFYINPSELPEVNRPWNELCSLEPCFGLAWLYAGTLQPGQSVVLNSSAQSAGNPSGYLSQFSNWPGYFANGTTSLYAVVDSWNRDGTGEVRDPNGAVLESDETNNLAERPITVTPGTLPAAPAAGPRAIPARP